MNRARSWSLRNLIIGQFLLVVFVAAVVAGALVAFWRLPMVRAQAEAEHTRIMLLTMDQIQTLLDVVETTQRSVVTVMQRQPKRSIMYLQEVVQTAADTDLLGSVLVLDDDARLIAVAADAPWSARSQELLGHDLGNLPGLTEAATRSTALWSDHYHSVVQDQPVVALLQRVGEHTVILEMALERLTRRIRTVSAVDGLLVVVTDGRGEVVASSMPGLAETRQNIRNLPIVQQALLGQSVTTEFALEQGSFVGMARQVAPLNWVVLTGYPADTAYASRRAAVGISAITLLLAVVTGIALFDGLAGSFRREVQRTVGYAQQVSLGQYGPPPTISRISELQVLDRNLGDMARRIQNREGQLQAMVDSTPNVAIQWFDAQGSIVRWNRASERVLGWTAQEALGRNLGDLIYTPEQAQSFLSILQQVEQTGEFYGPYEGDVHDRRGEAITLLSTTFAIPDEVHGKLFVCMDVDITAIKKQEQAVRASQQRFNLLFDASPVAVAVLERTPQGYLCTGVNEAFHALTGRRPAQSLPAELTASELFFDEASLRQRLNLLGPGSERVDLEGEICLPNGTVRHIEGVAGWVHSAPHDLIIISAYDVTERHRLQSALRELNTELEQRIADRTQSLAQANTELRNTLQILEQTKKQLVHSEKLASLGELVAGVAHELNTPIGNALMVTSTLTQRLKEFEIRRSQGLKRSDLEALLEQIQQASDIANRNLTRVAELVSSFKRVAVDQTSEQRRQFNLSELVHEILLTLQPSMKKLPIAVTVDVAPIPMDSYPGPFGQVITNLIQNAVLHAFGPQGGSIHIQATTLVPNRVAFSVCDNGRGIPVELMQRVFDPFFTTRLGQGGSGLGLHITHNLVVGVLGGQIEVQPAQPHGVCFRITLPCTAPHPTVL